MAIGTGVAADRDDGLDITLAWLVSGVGSITEVDVRCENCGVWVSESWSDIKVQNKKDGHDSELVKCYLVLLQCFKTFSVSDAV